jgi:iron(III) transport system substrate-binding protein
MRRLLHSALAACLSVFATASAAAPAELVVYTARIEDLIKPLFDRYTAETGVKIRYVVDREGPLMARLEAEGSSTPADLFMTVDAGNLWQAARRDLLLPLKSPVLDANIPEHLRDPDDRWVGLSVRARTIVYSTARVKPAQLSTYEALAEPQWKGKLCLRTSKKVYNQSLVAMMTAEIGAERTQGVVKGWVANLAAPPFADDVAVINAIAAGRCDVGLVNTYYFGRELRSNPQLPAALFWPNQSSAKNQMGGVHVNVSGAGVTKFSRNPVEAQKLLEWLSGAEAQAFYAKVNLEYPASDKAKPDPEVAAWGSFKPDLINVAKAGEGQVAAVRLMDRAGYK